jgi:alanyl-tRNA synthetase
MKKLTTHEIRSKFIEYFEKHDHLKIQASSVIPKNDPTLLFINSGMAPLKNYFLAKEEPPKKRLTNYQPCIRTKDIDDVGDRHHLTIFEMLGSWSIGDYYKEEACRLAYDLLVNEFGFDPKKLYMTVYGGSKDKGIESDEESVKAWMKCGVPADHIIRLGEDNFWGPAGDTGPCGPCTEVFYDTGEQHGPEYRPGGHFDDKSRYIEIWNAGVFMELNKNADGSFSPLPLKSVDTGSGLERMSMVMNGHESVYETDLMKPIVDLVSETYKLTDVRKIRMITDHMRASAFIMAEGIAPSNEGQGYIPRRLIRKCVAALVAHKVKTIDFTPIVDKVIELLSPYYPLLASGRESCLYNLRAEVSEFTPIITHGLNLIEEEVKKKKSKTFSGQYAFELVTTFGLPLEVLQADLLERGLTLDEKDYERCYEEHRKKSRVISRKGSVNADQEAIEQLIASKPETKFVGYETLVASGKVLGLIKNNQWVNILKSGEEGFLLSDSTPFYGESGGQVGDQGELKTSSARVAVVDTLKYGKHHLHQIEVLEGELSAQTSVELTVDAPSREATKRHHTATHLLHSALHLVIGKHAVQKGSMVRADRLRFDFQHNKALSREEIEEIERLVNEWIMANSKRDEALMAYDEAIEKGAMALFGEKYDSKVRVIKFGDSVELCGGTHVESTGDIGMFLIASEAAIAKGVRRIEAVTGTEALKLAQERQRLVKDVSEFLNTGSESVMERLKDMRQKMKELTKAPKPTGQVELKQKIEHKAAGLDVLVAEVSGDLAELKTFGDQLMDKGNHGLICLLGNDEKTIRVLAWSHKSLQGKIKASDVVMEILKPVGGRGGGKPQFAQGGTPEIEKLSELLSYAKTGFNSWVEQRLG